MLHLLHKACSLFNNKKQFDKNKTIEEKTNQAVHQFWNAVKILNR